MFSPVINFFYGWYIDDTKNFWNWFMGTVKFFDRDIGLVGNMQNWLSPLYGDYSYLGRLIGPILRTFRIFFGLFIYLIISVVFLLLYLIWAILPMAVIAMIILNLSAL